MPEDRESDPRPPAPPHSAGPHSLRRSPDEVRRAWLTSAIVALALLFVPFVFWLILPAPPKIAIPQVVAATNEPEEPEEAEPPADPTPRTYPTRRPPPKTSTDTENTVKGRVIGPDGAPVPRAWVGCTDRDKNTVSDRDGTYELPPDAAGCAAVARKAGFGSSEKSTVKAGDDKSNTLQLLAGGRIEGVVVDERGTPVPKYMLGVEKFIGAEGDDTGMQGRARTIEDAQGRFTMDNMTPGKYVLAASADGRPPARSDTLEVEPGRSVTGVRIVLPQGAVLTGTVTDADTRKPIAGARVALDTVSLTGLQSAKSVRTDDSGAFTIEGVPPEENFSIRVDKTGYRARILSGLSARGSGSTTTEVELTPRGENDKADSEMGGIGAILGPPLSSFGAMVLGVTRNGPADQAGLKPNDRIVRIDGQSTENMTLAACIQQLRGEPGTRVSVLIDRDGQEMSFDLTRALVVR